MILSFASLDYKKVPLIIKQERATNTADKLKMGFLVYGMEILLVQLNVSLIKLAFSSQSSKL